VLIAVLGFVVAMLFWSERKNTIVWTDRALTIEGPYGRVIPLEKIDSIKLLDDLPEISSRLHGYSTGSVAKGKFKGPKGVRYHLLLDKPYERVLKISISGEPPILLSLEGVDEVALAELLKNRIIN
jgi:hypothetical protein